MTLWKDSLLIGVPEIDKQHRKLVEAIDKLLAECAKGQGRSVIAETLLFVVEYTKKHFSDEEKIFSSFNYPHAGNHKNLHTKFISSISVLVTEYEKGGSTIVLTGKINKILVDWLVKHITIEDRIIGEFIRSKMST